MLGPGDVVGDRFELVHLAAEGGMGAVFRAHDRCTGEAVAVKVVRTVGASSTRFAREAVALARIRHRAVVRHIAHDVESSPAWIAMEWLEGVELAERIGGLTVLEAIRLVAEIAEGLAEAHRQGLIHRDLKPSNVFLAGGDPSRPKLLDFGLARDLDTAVTLAGTPLGTPGYMAPEQVRGDAQIDARADVFALGCVLYECLAGKPAFAGGRPIATIARVLFDEPPAIEELRSDVPASLARLLRRMLSKSPEGRPADAEAVATEIVFVAEQHADDEETLTRRTLTPFEQALVSVVVAPPGSVDAAARRKLPRGLARHGARLEAPLDGSLLVVVAGPWSAVEQVTRAARCALLVRQALPLAPLALVTGRAELAGSTPVGEVVDRAVDLLGTDGEGVGEIRVDAVTAGLLPARFSLTLAAERHVLLGEEAFAAPDRPLLRERVPCVGRERETATATTLADACFEEGAAQAVLVVGEAGVGKSRLCREILDQLVETRPDLTVWRGRGDAIRSPFGVLSRMLSEACGIRRDMPPAEQRAVLSAWVARSVDAEDTTRVASFLGELVDVPFPDLADVQLEAARADARLMGDQMRRAFLDYARAVLERGPLVVLVDDLHWADPPSVALLDALLGGSAESPLFVLADADPEVHEAHPDLFERHPLVTLRLRPLRPALAARLLRAHLGESIDEAVVERIVARANGNAFFLEELARAHREGAADDAATVLATVQGRLGRLPAELRRVLRAASVFGERFWPAGVAQLLGVAPGDPTLEGHLEALAHEQVIGPASERRLAGLDELAFVHGLVRDAAYQTLTAADRQTGHALAAEWLEGAGEPSATVLAEHHELGGRADRATPWWTRAAQDALEANDVDTAIRVAERALSRATGDAARGQLAAVAADAHYWFGDNDSAYARAELAASLLSPGDPAHSRALRTLGVCGMRAGRVDELERCAQELLALAREHGGHALEALASIAPAVAYSQLAATVAAIEALIESRPDPDGRLRRPLHEMRAFRAISQGRGGLFVSEMREACACAERSGDARRVLGAATNIGHMLVELGSVEEGEALLSRTLAEARRLGLQIIASNAQHNLGRAYLRRGRVAEARETQREAAREFELQGNPAFVALARMQEGMCALAAGEHEEARSLLDEARRTLVDTNPALVARAQAWLAFVALGVGDVETARWHADEAMRDLRERGWVREGEGEVRLAQVEVLHASGDHEAARRTAREALRRAEELAAELRDAGERRRYLEEEPTNVRLRELAG